MADEQGPWIDTNPGPSNADRSQRKGLFCRPCKKLRVFVGSHIFHNAPVICVSGPLGAGDTGDIAGLKCRDLTADESRQCRRCAGVLISRLKAYTV